MRLRTIGKPLTDELITALEALNIKTETDLLFSRTPTDIWLKLPSDIITLKEFNGIVKQVIAKLAAPVYSGPELLALANKRREKHAAVGLDIGVKDLDGLVNGFGIHQVLEVSGDTGSGKTILALQIVLRQLSRYPNSSAVWIDTTGDISADRISSTLESCSGQGSDTALQRLEITRAFDVDALQEALEEIRIRLSSSMDFGQPTLRTIVIDSVTPIFRPLLSAITAQGHAAMTTFMRQLRTYAEDFSLTIFVLNATSASLPNNPRSSFASTNRKPALGPSFTYQSDATLWLAREPKELTGHGDADVDEDDGSVLHVAEVFRSKLAQSKTWCTFRIRNGVIVNDESQPP